MNHKDYPSIDYFRLPNEPSRYLFWDLRKITHSPNMLRSVRNIIMKAILCTWLMEFGI
nr:unnamed protein product [Callosobruchus chinensis]